MSMIVVATQLGTLVLNNTNSIEPIGQYEHKLY